MNRPVFALFSVICSATSAQAQEACANLSAAAVSASAIREQLCAPPPGERFPVKLRAPVGDEQEVITIDAAKIEGVNNEFLQAETAVDLRTPSKQVLANWVRYEIPSDTIRARGKVVLRSWEDLVRGPELEYKRDTATGYMKMPEYVLGTYHSRGKADELHFTGPQKYRIYEGSYSTCVDESPAWHLEVSELDINQVTSIGTAQNARLYIGSVPIGWFPQLSFALDNRRKSGFLTPIYGTSGTRGFDIQIPYYLNLAPNYDATITPRWMSRRGMLLNGETRYLFDTPLGQASGIWAGEYLPDDQAARNISRNATKIRHTQIFNPNLTLQANYNHVSDSRYFVDLADYVGVTSITTLPRDLTLSYRNFDWIFTAKAQRFQTLQDPGALVLPPYNRTPQLIAESPVYRFGSRQQFEFQSTVDATYFEFPNKSSPSGSRAYNYSTLAWRHDQPSGFVVPKIGLHATNYKLRGEFDDYRNSRRVLPITSLDSGLYFERNSSLFGTAFMQTLEPRALFTYIPYRNQSETPVFDTALADFNQLQLFSENRYIGQDRIGDTKQLALGLTSRFYDPVSQKERLRFTLGERLYFSNQRVTLGEAARDRNSSDVLFSAHGRVTDTLFVEGNAQYNADLGQTERYSVGLRYTPERTRNFNINYRAFRQLATQSGPVSVKQIDVSAQWPIYRNLYGLGRFNYSIADRRLTEGILGFEYDGCCYIVRAVAQRLATSSTTVTNAVFLQLELNGLGRIGSNPLDLLKRNIPGYAELYENPARRNKGLNSSYDNAPLFTPWNPTPQ